MKDISMAKIKYRFNPESLGYDKVKTSVMKVIVKAFTFITATVAITVVYYLIYSRFFSTPKERILSREINQMTENYATLTKNLERIEDVLADIQQRDSNLYRTIFESEPVPQAVLRAGFGGVNRYEAWEGYSNSGLMIETTRRSEELMNQLQVQSKMMNELLEKVNEKNEQLKTRPAIQPIENKDLTYTAAGYGWKMHPFYRSKRFHEGNDFTAPVGTSVIATGDGEVVETQSKGPEGRKIVIDHGYGYKTVYAHLDKFTVKPKQKVTRGEIIGMVGNTGLSTAPHLHYEVHKNGKPVNPINYFFNDLSPAGFARIRDLSNLGRTFD
jgi:murein DD-endopeptidase MepM/ murein hydrolase activator NlpD